MDLHQYVEPELSGQSIQLGEAGIVQTSSNQQDAVRTQGAGLVDLIGVDDEVLADHRQGAGRARRLEILVAPLKEITVGQHRKTGRALAGIALRDLGGPKIRAQHTLARTGLLDLGDHRRGTGLDFSPERVGEPARRIGLM